MPCGSLTRVRLTKPEARHGKLMLSLGRGDASGLDFLSFTCPRWRQPRLQIQSRHRPKNVLAIALVDSPSLCCVNPGLISCRFNSVVTGVWFLRALHPPFVRATARMLALLCRRRNEGIPTPTMPSRGRRDILDDGPVLPPSPERDVCWRVLDHGLTSQSVGGLVSLCRRACQGATYRLGHAVAAAGHCHHHPVKHPAMHGPGSNHPGRNFRVSARSAAEGR